MITIVHKFFPRRGDSAFYEARTDRNIGWIMPEEQQILRKSIVGIAGTGGMGGLLASILVRAGIGEVRIADSEVFDFSNINRQFAATRKTVGKSKALETARMLRAITDDSTIVVYPQGITEETVDRFVSDCSIICDEIEAFAIDARILLHCRARKAGVSLFNCNSVGFGTNLFLYTPSSMTMEEALGIDYENAKQLRLQSEEGDTFAAEKIVHAIIRAVVPKLPEYRPQEVEGDVVFVYRRMLTEGKVPIIASNPTFAAGFIANRILLYLLRNSGVRRDIMEIPEMPGYLYLDAAQLQAYAKKGTWF